MEIKKLNNYTEIFLENQHFIFDPPDLKAEPPLILTDSLRKVNRDKIFNAPGEYNVGEVYFWGFDDQKTVSYFFEWNEGCLFYYNGEVSNETLKKLKFMKSEHLVLFAGSELKEKLVSELKPKIIITYKDANFVKSFDRQKVDKIKINLKKVPNLLLILRK